MTENQSEAKPADAVVRVVLAASPSFREMVFAAGSMDRLSAVGEVVLLDDPGDADALMAALPGADVLITSWGATPLTAEVLTPANRLQLIAHAASSVKHFITDEVFRRGIRVTQAGQAMARPVAEVSLAFTLSMLHRIHRFNHTMHAGGWREEAIAPTSTGTTAGTSDVVLAQHGLAGSRIGVVGASRTGLEYIRMLVALGADIAVYDPYLTNERAAGLGVRTTTLDELLRTSRVVALHAPTLPETRHMIGARELALMPDGAALVNTARSWLVDTAALLAELRSGRIDAALDVFDEEPLPADDPVRTLPNVLLTPHRAAGTVECYFEMGELTAAEVERFSTGQPLHHELTRSTLAHMA
ncbi:hydroxyacid dehydrogenase [Kribbella solani]|uniref:Phosphoglycerate dehydrogenase-like enzyme n=1 Tax=Kribbella solani TaxID=236067 RepID=A0A841DQC1_9ACTN|nr:hydroxyacid dehydrogenase [Kribbella solani]MBB5980101.1 phosphoglycerate dehydrogenase-like enzyme [Kribbella solani]